LQCFFASKASLELSFKAVSMHPVARRWSALDLPLPNSSPPLAGYDKVISNRRIVVVGQGGP
jgi:hypothetical protein